VPGHEELAMGAMAPGGAYQINSSLVEQLRIPPEAIRAALAREGNEIRRQEKAFGAAPIRLRGMDVILVDDGLATGSTMHVAVQAVRESDPAKVIVAVPVAPPDAVDAFAEEADEFVTVLIPEYFSAVGEWYESFPQVSDDEVRHFLQLAKLSEMPFNKPVTF
jgi:predicted phosphoribosyltransferase